MTDRLCTIHWPSDEPQTVEELSDQYGLQESSYLKTPLDRERIRNHCAQSFEDGYKAAALDASAEIKRLEANLKMETARVRYLGQKVLEFERERKVHIEALTFYATRQHQRHNWIEDGDVARAAIEPEGSDAT